MVKCIIEDSMDICLLRYIYPKLCGVLSVLRAVRVNSLKICCSELVLYATQQRRRQQAPTQVLSENVIFTSSDGLLITI